MLNIMPVLLKFDFQVTVTLLWRFFGKSMLIFGLTMLFALPLGLLVCACRRSKFKPLQLLTKLYISVMRGTPLMLQLVVVYFAPYYVFGIKISSDYRFYAVIIGFVLNYAAYFAEIYRGGIEAINIGQHEAAQVLGFNKFQTFFRIILPQVIKIVLPSITNETITLVKDTSLAFAISYVEMFTTAKQVVTQQSSILPLFVAGAFYYATNLVIAFLLEGLEKKLNYYNR